MTKIPFTYRDAPVETILETLKRDIEEIHPQQGLYIVIKNDEEGGETIYYDYAGMDDEQLIANLEKVKYLFLRKRYPHDSDD